MMEENFDNSTYRPRFPGVVELNLGDEWRAYWNEGAELPDAPATYVYTLLYRGDKGYVVRARGSRDPWSTVEGAPNEGEDADSYVRRAVHEQAGATVARAIRFGHLECRATSHNPNYPAGAITVRPAYIVVADTLDDVPEGSRLERRRLSLSEHAMTIRNRYPELAAYFNRAAQDYAVMLAKGEALA